MCVINQPYAAFVPLVVAAWHCAWPRLAPPCAASPCGPPRLVVHTFVVTQLMAVLGCVCVLVPLALARVACGMQQTGENATTAAISRQQMAQQIASAGQMPGNLLLESLRFHSNI